MFKFSDMLYYADLSTMEEGNLFLSYMILQHNESKHENWLDCECNGAEWLKEMAEVALMDEDSPNNMLSQDEHMKLFNEKKLLYSGVGTDVLIARRQMLKIAIAKLRTHVQAKTVILNERRMTATRKEKEAIKKADKAYSPALRPEEKADPMEVRLYADINEVPFLKKFMQNLPTPAHKAALKMMRDLGIRKTLSIMKIELPEGIQLKSEIKEYEEDEDE